MLQIISIITFFLTTFHSISYTDTNGKEVSFSTFKGEKVLIVNIATESPNVDQLSGLQDLQNRFGDSLVIIAFPSNSFGNESRTDGQIRTFCKKAYGATFRIAQKGEVRGNAIQAIYNWLSKASQNGVVNGNVTADFQKFLIDGEGNLVGFFSPKVQPMNSSILKAIAAN
jgi:glutathione peroxidase